MTVPRVPGEANAGLSTGAGRVQLSCCHPCFLGGACVSPPPQNGFCVVGGLPRQLEGCCCVSSICCLRAALTHSPAALCFPGSQADFGHKDAQKAFLKWWEGVQERWEGPFPVSFPAARPCVPSQRSCRPGMLCRVGNGGQQHPGWGGSYKLQSFQSCFCKTRASEGHSQVSVQEQIPFRLLQQY